MLSRGASQNSEFYFQCVVDARIYFMHMHISSPHSVILIDRFFEASAAASGFEANSLDEVSYLFVDSPTKFKI